MIFGARVRQAREFRDLRQQDVAALLGVSPARVAQIELSNEPVRLSPDQLSALSAASRLPESFFEVPIFDQLSDGSMRFRARRKLTRRQLSKVRREAELAHELAHACLSVVDAPSVRIPALSSRVTPDDAAEQARAALGVPPSGPVLHVLRTLERAGVWVFPVDTGDSAHLDAFSTWVGPHLDRPVLAISDSLVWDRARHTAAHELGHLVMHQAVGDDAGSGDDIEHEADAFASAFLMPACDARAELPQPFVLSSLMPLKLRWGMSMQSMISRAASLELISAEHRTSLFKQLSARQWRTREPGWDARATERPRALLKMVELAYGAPVDIRRLSREVGRYPADIARDLERYDGPVRTKRVPATRETRRDTNVVQLDFRRAH